MSDTAGRRKSGTGRAQSRRRPTQRGGKRFAAATASSASTALTATAPAEELPEPALRSRRPRIAAPQRVAALSREAEYAYIRADMRRLLIIAGSLFALMLVILVIVGR